MLKIQLSNEANVVLLNIGQLTSDTDNLTLKAINYFNNVEIIIPLGVDTTAGKPVYNRYILAGSLFSTLGAGFANYEVISPEHTRPIDTGLIELIGEAVNTITLPPVDDDVIQFKPQN